MSRFSGKVVLVTGSTSGIGAATVRRFHEEGASVVINSTSSVEAGQALAAELDRSIYVQADVANAQDCERLITSAVEAFSGIDILINNAGFTQAIPHHDFDAVSDELFEKILRINLVAPFRLFRLALPHLRASGDGSVVNVSSMAGVRPAGSSVPYAASKAGLNHLTALLANACGSDVRINAIAPGLIETPWTADWHDVREAVKVMAPLTRSGTAEEVANQILDIAGATYMTGQVVVVDGGLSLR